MARETTAMSPISVEPVSPDEAPASEPPPQIPYESAASPISRRQFRFLVMLTLFNTLMLGIFVAGPGVSRITGGWWQDYKRWQADRVAAQQKAQAQKKFEADFQAALQFRAPENQLVSLMAGYLMMKPSPCNRAKGELSATTAQVASVSGILTPPHRQRAPLFRPICRPLPRERIEN